MLAGIRHREAAATQLQLVLLLLQQLGPLQLPAAADEGQTAAAAAAAAERNDGRERNRWAYLQRYQMHCSAAG
jgi:hypothetical protein